jgi:hypothetical protein
MATKQRIPSPGGNIQGGFNAFDDLADSIAVPDPTRPLRNAIGSAGRRYCNAIGAAPGLYGDILRNTQGVPSLLCKPYWDRNNLSAPVLAAPFTGGQCTGSYTITYSATAEQKSCSTGAVTATRTRASGIVGTTFTGPITEVYLQPNVSTDCGFGSYDIVIKSNGGATNSAFNVFSPTTTGSAQLVVTGFNVSVARVGGGDTCGDAEPELRPGPRPPSNPGAYPTGEEPGVDPDGQPFFFVPPIPPVVPGVDIPDGPVIAPPGGGGGGGTPPGPAEPGEPGEGTEPEGEAPDGEEIYAIVVEFLTVPPYARQVEPGLYVSPCRVFLGTDFGLDLDEAGRAMRSGQAIFAETDGLTKWRVSASVGFTVRVTPYYREKAS